MTNLDHVCHLKNKIQLAIVFLEITATMLFFVETSFHTLHTNPLLVSHGLVTTFKSPLFLGDLMIMSCLTHWHQNRGLLDLDL